MRWVGVVLVVGGLALAGTGLARTLSGEEGADTADAVAQTEPTTSAAAVAQTEPSTRAAEREDPREFFELFEAAFRTGDRAFFIERLHPAVLERYGAEQCRAYAGGLHRPDLVAEVLSVAVVDTFEYETDGLRTTIEGDGYRARVRLSTEGSAQTQSAHLAHAGDELRWFTDCGEPR